MRCRTGWSATALSVASNAEPAKGADNQSFFLCPDAVRGAWIIVARAEVRRQALCGA